MWLWRCPRLSARAGGEFVFDFGFGKLWRGEITAFEVPHLIDFGGFLRFELSQVPNGSRLAITQKRTSSGWSPMALAGFHGWLGRLSRLLDGVPNDAADRWANERYPWEALFLAYERLIRDSLAGGATPIYRLHFDENTLALTAEAKTHLDKLIRVLKEKPTLSVTIDGFGDDPCPQEESVALAAKRIGASRRYLEARASHRSYRGGFTLGNYHFIVPRDTRPAAHSIDESSCPTYWGAWETPSCTELACRASQIASGI